MANGTVRCWAGFVPAEIPAPITRLGGMFAITNNGDLYSLLDGSRIDIHDVVRVDSDYALAAADTSACAVTSAGDLYCWGNNALGQVGDGTTVVRPSPVLVGTSFVDVQTAVGISCGLSSDGEVKCWGKSAGSLMPTPIGLGNAVELAGISDVLLRDGRVIAIAWGPGAVISQLYPPL